MIDPGQESLALATVEFAAWFHKIKESVVLEMIRTGKLRSERFRGETRVDLAACGAALRAGEAARG